MEQLQTENNAAGGLSDLIVILEAAEALRRQHAELRRLAMKNAAYASLTKSQDDELSLHRDRAAAYRAAVKNIDSEREANAILTAERDAAISAAVAAEREAHAADIERLKRERHHIYDLLARIHRDGGQYAAEHGVEKACDDAEAQVVAWLDTINGIDALIEQARIAERAAISAELRELADELGYGSSWWGPPGGLLLRAADMVSARGKKWQ